MAQPARKPWFIVWSSGTQGGNQAAQVKAMTDLVERQSGTAMIFEPT